MDIVETEKNVDIVSESFFQYIEKNKAQDGATLVLLKGDLGAGKTTLIRAFLKKLGYAGNVVSPTFTLMQNYNVVHSSFSKVVHIDAYRFEKYTELETLRFNELLEDAKTLIFLEWPERAFKILPDSMIISIGHESEVSRRYQIDKLGEASI